MWRLGKEGVLCLVRSISVMRYLVVIDKKVQKGWKEEWEYEVGEEINKKLKWFQPSARQLCCSKADCREIRNRESCRRRCSRIT